MDISNHSIEALKALAYDLIVQLDGIQKNLNLVNAQIAKKQEDKKAIKEGVAPVEEGKVVKS